MKCRGSLLVGIALSLAGCGIQGGGSLATHVQDGSYNFGIMNGSEVHSADSFSRHVVFLQVVTANGVGDCTGSILDSETILTAAHCVAGGKQGVIVFADNVQNPKAVDKTFVRIIDKVSIFPKFQPQAEGDNSGGEPQAPPGPDQVPSVQEVQNELDQLGEVDYDVAVLHFKGGLPAGYSPVTLAEDASIVGAGSTLQMIGYGLSKVDPVTKVLNGKTMIFPQPVQTTVGQLRETAIAVESYDTKIGMIFTSGTRSSVCSGDSGGPGFIKDPKTGEPVQVGIAEAVATAYCNSVSMHTAVFPYLEWIKQVQAKMSQPATAAPVMASAATPMILL